MKKLYTLVLAAMMAVGANAQMISFSEASSGSLDGKTFENDGLVLTITDTDGKVAIDKNNAYFGTAKEKQQFGFRLKSGGKSSSKNVLALTVPADGVLKIYARTGSNSATDRNIKITQNGEAAADHILLESEAVTESYTDDAGEEKSRSIYPVVAGNVVKGDVVIEYPVGSVNIYAIELVAGGAESVNVVSADSSSAVKKVVKDGKVVISGNGAEYSVSGAIIK